MVDEGEERWQVDTSVVASAWDMQWVNFAHFLKIDISSAWQRVHFAHFIFNDIASRIYTYGVIMH